MYCYIYKISNKIDGKIYIGFTSKTVEDRYRQHLKEAKKNNNKRNIYLYNAINKHGEENFTVELVRRTKNLDYGLNKLEPYYIKKYNSLYPIGYNLTTGGEGVGGVKKTPAQKQHLSKMANKRYKHDKTIKQKISRAIKTLWEDEKYRDMMSKKMKNGWTVDAKKIFSKKRKLICSSKKWRKRQSELQKLRCQNVDYTNKISNTLCKFLYKIIMPNGQVEYTKSLRKFAIAHNLSSGTLYNVVNGRIKQYNGYKAERITNEKI
jgi:group I intron endonuclease